jgi:antitoxin HigA-1
MKSLRDPKRRPTHPGAILREDVLPAIDMTQTELAERLGVSRLSVSKLLHEKRALSPEMAVRLAVLLNTSPESWLRMQETCR